MRVGDRLVVARNEPADKTFITHNGSSGLGLRNISIFSRN